MTPSKAPRPSGLGKAGAALWARLAGAYVFDVRELVVLELAARQADDVARLEAAVTTDGVVVQGAAGQPRLSGVVTEVRQSRLALARLLAELALPGDEQVVGVTPSSRHAQRAAAVRWSRVRREAGDDVG